MIVSEHPDWARVPSAVRAALRSALSPGEEVRRFQARAVATVAGEVALVLTADRLLVGNYRNVWAWSIGLADVTIAAADAEGRLWVRFTSGSSVGWRQRVEGFGFDEPETAARWGEQIDQAQLLRKSRGLARNWSILVRHPAWGELELLQQRDLLALVADEEQVVGVAVCHREVSSFVRWPSGRWPPNPHAARIALALTSHRLLRSTPIELSAITMVAAQDTAVLWVRYEFGDWRYTVGFEFDSGTVARCWAERIDRARALVAARPRLARNWSQVARHAEWTHTPEYVRAKLLNEITDEEDVVGLARCQHLGAGPLTLVSTSARILIGVDKVAEVGAIPLSDITIVQALADDGLRISRHWQETACMHDFGNVAALGGAARWASDVQQRLTAGR